jgi:hypothetical protein
VRYVTYSAPLTISAYFGSQACGACSGQAIWKFGLYDSVAFACGDCASVKKTKYKWLDAPPETSPGFHVWPFIKPRSVGQKCGDYWARRWPYRCERRCCKPGGNIYLEHFDQCVVVPVLSEVWWEHEGKQEFYDLTAWLDDSVSQIEEVSKNWKLTAETIRSRFESLWKEWLVHESRTRKQKRGDRHECPNYRH